MQVMRAKINKASFIKKMQVPSAGTEENIHRNPQTLKIAAMQFKGNRYWASHSLS